MFLSLLFYLIAFFIGVLIIRSESVLYQKTFLIMILSLLGHAAGTYLYYLSPSDSSMQYFPLAKPYFTDLGTGFVENMVWYVRYFLTGDSLLSTFYFFSAFAFLGSISWYALYLKLIKKLPTQGPTLTWPALILMCWPSFLLFTTGMGKDSLCFFFIPLMLLSYFNIRDRKNLAWNMFLLIFSVFLLAMLRPYLLMILSISYYLYTFRGLRSLNIRGFLLLVGMLCVAGYSTYWVLTTQGQFDTVNLTSIAQRSELQQDRQAIGTFFYMPSVSPIMRLLLLPYSFIMNLCFPLFYLARNIAGYLASLENCLLIILIGTTWRFRRQVKKLFLENRNLKLLFYFFIIGVFFLAAANTNLGLSMRQKSMYLPAFLLIYCVLYTQRRMRKVT